MSGLPRRIAHDVTLDGRDGRIYIEGVEMPFHVGPDVEVTDHGDGLVWSVSLQLYADNIEIISQKGERRTVSTDRTRYEQEFARREARRIVHEGMADVLEWLWAGKDLAAASDSGRYVLGLDESERQALASTAFHSESAHRENGDQK